MLYEVITVKSWIAGRHFPADFPLVDLCQAIPDYAPARELTDHLTLHLAEPMTSKYSPDEGLPEVRQAIGRWYGRMYGATIAPERMCLTIGASQAFWLAMLTLCQAGDEVV